MIPNFSYHSEKSVQCLLWLWPAKVRLSHVWHCLQCFGVSFYLNYLAATIMRERMNELHPKVTPIFWQILFCYRVLPKVVSIFVDCHGCSLRNVNVLSITFNCKLAFSQLITSSQFQFTISIDIYVFSIKKRIVWRWWGNLFTIFRKI